MDGFEATAAIRQREAAAGTHIPIVATTTRAMRGDREECIAAGMDDYISQPIGVAQVQAAMAAREAAPPKPASLQIVRRRFTP